MFSQSSVVGPMITPRGCRDQHRGRRLPEAYRGRTDGRPPGANRVAGDCALANAEGGGQPRDVSELPPAATWSAEKEGASSRRAGSLIARPTILARAHSPTPRMRRILRANSSSSSVHRPTPSPRAMRADPMDPSAEPVARSPTLISLAASQWTRSSIVSACPFPPQRREGDSVNCAAARFLRFRDAARKTIYVGQLV